MIIDPKLKWLYVGPPKTGSTTLHKLLVKEPFTGTRIGVAGNPVDKFGQHSSMLPEEVDEAWRIFVSVRNPYTRIVSLWLHSCNQHKNIDNAEIRKYNPLLSFSEFVEFCCTHSTTKQCMWSAQHVYLEDITVKGFTPELWRLEQLKKDIAKSMSFFSIVPPSIVVENSTRPLMTDHGKQAFVWSSVYTSDLILKVRQWAGKDFELLGYSPDFTWPLSDVVVSHDPILVK